MPRFYHFTALAYLPAILRDGIIKGELPLLDRPYDQRPQFPNLTTVRTPQKHSIWNRSIFDKTRVRIEIDDTDLEIKSFTELFQEYGMPEKFVRALSPNNEHRAWYHSIGPIAPTAFKILDIAIESPSVYKRIRQPALENLCSHISDEYEMTFLPMSADGTVNLRNQTAPTTCWLFDAARYQSQRTGEYRPLPRNWRKEPVRTKP